jgi:hypothetical protein
MARPAPDEGPGVRVIWVLMGCDVQEPAPWGEVIEIEEADSHAQSRTGAFP